MDTETATSPPAKQPPAKQPPAKQPPAPLEDAQHFFSTLARWRDDSQGPSQRGKLAQLKRNAGENLPGRNVLWFYELLHQGNVQLRLRRQNEYFLLATLFDLNRYSGSGGQPPDENLGGTLRRTIQQRSVNEESVRRRLQILLDADFEEYGQLRDACERADHALPTESPLRYESLLKTYRCTPVIGSARYRHYHHGCGIAILTTSFRF
jgi:hypothetical protein